MYWHYIRHNLKPSEWYAMGPGEKIIMRSFMLKEIEAEQAEKEQIREKIEEAERR